jgi:hypothetical protein
LTQENNVQAKIYRMRYFVTVSGQTHSAFAELIFDNARPFAVLAWNDPKTRDQPLVAFPLDAAALRESQAEDADFIYGEQFPGSKPN